MVNKEKKYQGYLQKAVKALLEGPIEGGVPSTLVLFLDKKVNVMREGGISEQEIYDCLK